MRSTLFDAAALAQATSTEEDTVCHLENYTGLLTGLQKLVITMASGYEAATEDVRSLVASTLDVVTQQDRNFIAGASQAHADWTAKYQHAMSQGENGSLGSGQGSRHCPIPPHYNPNHRAGAKAQCQVRYSGPSYRPASNVFGSGPRPISPKVNATLPSLLCRFMAPDQAGQIMVSIFTCLCNYNTEICGMAMAQTVVPVYTIPNTYWVQQSLWESLCRIIPGIACTSESELHSFEPTAPRNIPVGQSDTVPGTGNSGESQNWDCWIGEPAKCSSFIVHLREGCHSGNLPRRPSGRNPSGWFQMGLVPTTFVPTVNLANNGDPPDANPPETSTPIKATPESGKRHSKKKLNISKIGVTHLLFNMRDR